MKQYIVTGMSCAACQARVEKAVSKVEGVDSVNVSLLTNSMSVEGEALESNVIEAVVAAGYDAKLKEPASGREEKGISASKRLEMEEETLKDHETPKLIRRLKLSVGFLVVLMYIGMGSSMLGLPVPAFLSGNYMGLALTQMLLALIVMYINRAFFDSGFKSLFHAAPNMDTLVALGSSVSFGWSVYAIYKMTYMIATGSPQTETTEIYHSQLYFDSAAMIPALITVGKTLESLSKGRTTDALKTLMKMAPKMATIERDGRQVTVDIDEVQKGDIFVVKPGEAVPVDGVIIEGETAIDESALTGESVPADKAPGDSISAATINRSGFVRARASRVGEDTTFSKVIRMVSDAAATKAPIARIADRVSGVFVPVVIGIAVIVFFIWMFKGIGTTDSLERAICVLVISCPCALGLATPVAIMVGNGVGAKNGILFKTGESLETAGKIQIAALDKTGTITEGKPEVTDIITAKDVAEDELLQTAYLLEVRSEHPLAKAVVAAVKTRQCPLLPIEKWRALSGSGVAAEQGGEPLYAGSGKFIRTVTDVNEEMAGHEKKLSEEGKTPLFFARAGKLLGIIAVADVIKSDSARAVKELQNMGIEVVMLTGDNERTANAIGKQAGVDTVIAGVLPDGKEAVIRELQKRGKVAMVGDGINDAPALMGADMGIAIGAGADVAVDSADVVLMNSKLTDVPAAVRLSRATLRNIHENLFWAFAYNVLLIPMAAGLYPGIEMNPMWGAAAMSVSSFTVCMNALRLNLFKIHGKSHENGLESPILGKNYHDGSESAVADKNAKEASDEGNAKAEGLKPEVITDNINAVENAAKERSDIEMEKTLKIDGMMCAHCEARMKKALEELDGVESAVTSHEKANAVLKLSKDVPEETLKKAVVDAGYEFGGIA